MTTRQTLAFIGLGVMGYPVAGHLARAGHAVTVYNRTERQGRAIRGRIWTRILRPLRADAARGGRGRRCRVRLRRQ